ncbi:MAG: hypothetical protein HKN07_01930 [Acidimicrobiia bacterium]|nr:hypothetical protein [Acidimicrobiia bacterium]NNF62993.1 hypothetical protein [Acidimicrobiia bacterium]
MTTTRIKTESDNSDSSSNPERRFVDMRFAIIGGSVAALVMFAGVVTVGSVTPFVGLKLLQSVLPTIRFLASSGLAAGATVMALMLTLIGLTFTSDWQFRDIHYIRIKQISLLATWTMLLSIVVLLFLGLPVEEADQLQFYYDVVYYAVLAAASILGGLLVAVALMLHRTISGLVAIGHPSGNSELIEDAD